jgi:hypothetical protein
MELKDINLSPQQRVVPPMIKSIPQSGRRAGSIPRREGVPGLPPSVTRPIPQREGAEGIGEGAGGIGVGRTVLLEKARQQWEKQRDQQEREREQQKRERDQLEERRKLELQRQKKERLEGLKRRLEKERLERERKERREQERKEQERIEKEQLMQRNEKLAMQLNSIVGAPIWSVQGNNLETGSLSDEDIDNLMNQYPLESWLNVRMGEDGRLVIPSALAGEKLFF